MRHHALIARTQTCVPSAAADRGGGRHAFRGRVQDLVRMTRSIKRFALYEKRGLGHKGGGLTNVGGQRPQRAWIRLQLHPVERFCPQCCTAGISHSLSPPLRPRQCQHRQEHFSFVVFIVVICQFSKNRSHIFASLHKLFCGRNIVRQRVHWTLRSQPLFSVENYPVNFNAH